MEVFSLKNILTLEMETVVDVINGFQSLTSINWNFSNANTGYLTHSLHPYPAKFIPHIPRTLIQELSLEGETVADIFCGSGTTLVEALTLRRNAVGVDANPLACLISQAKTTVFREGDEELLYSIAKRAQKTADSLSSLSIDDLFVDKSFASSANRPLDDAITFWFEPFVIEELAEVLSWCRALPTETSRCVALTAFSSIIVSVSRQDSDTRYVRREKKIFPGNTMQRFSRSLVNAIKAVCEFTNLIRGDAKCSVQCANVLTKPHIGKVDLVVCSPPYPNAYSYHLYHMTRMLWLGMDQPKFKLEEIGSHRKYSRPGENGSTAETFQREMEIVFRWLYDCLQTDRYACFVVGDSTIRGMRVNNASMISQIAKGLGFVEAACFSRHIHAKKKSFNPTIGKIKEEQIVVFQKKEKLT